MAIRPRIKPAAAQTEADEDIIAAIINRGGAPAGMPAVAEAEPPPPVAALPPSPAPVVEPPPPPAVVVLSDPEKKFTLRLPASLLAEIEKDAKGRPDRISVNTWLIGAALQRLERV